MKLCIFGDLKLAKDTSKGLKSSWFEPFQHHIFKNRRLRHLEPLNLWCHKSAVPTPPLLRHGHCLDKGRGYQVLTTARGGSIIWGYYEFCIWPDLNLWDGRLSHALQDWTKNVHAAKGQLKAYISHTTIISFLICDDTLTSLPIQQDVFFFISIQIDNL